MESDTILQGSRVYWTVKGTRQSGVVKEIHKKKVEMILSGSPVYRNASKSDPALLLEQDDGDLVLKLLSEVELG
jgi:hypothetical protein